MGVGGETSPAELGRRALVGERRPVVVDQQLGGLGCLRSVQDHLRELLRRKPLQPHPPARRHLRTLGCCLRRRQDIGRCLARGLRLRRRTLRQPLPVAERKTSGLEVTRSRLSLKQRLTCALASSRNMTGCADPVRQTVKSTSATTAGWSACAPSSTTTLFGWSFSCDGGAQRSKQPSESGGHTSNPTRMRLYSRRVARWKRRQRGQPSARLSCCCTPLTL